MHTASDAVVDRIDPLFSDPDGIHAAAVADLPPLDSEHRARIRALARAADPFTDKVRAVIRGGAA